MAEKKDCGCSRRAAKLKETAQHAFKYVVQGGKMVKMRVTKKD